IPAGEFMMGSPAHEVGRFNDEHQHRVRLTRSYFMQATPVTQGQWEAVMGPGTNPSFHQGNPELPVENVTFFDAVNYCNRLSDQEGLRPCYILTPVNGSPGEYTVTWDPEGDGYRLPTAAEWEHAARAGGTGATYAAEGQRLDAIAVYGTDATQPVGQK